MPNSPSGAKSLYMTIYGVIVIKIFMRARARKLKSEKISIIYLCNIHLQETIEVAQEGFTSHYLRDSELPSFDVPKAHTSKSIQSVDDQFSPPLFASLSNFP
ncbi:PREDICTED: uncharacterized protein LOC107172994 [Diuraphis noxia]|uniref:uncharacterized protein LOC107172994 n=1 Tax=Diuraphis noxia TaxID=143948 RepID=UPI0007639108|nr:PREDICTED: uncharacterized protein LOC107172994 [Diuraphis noxia]